MMITRPDKDHVNGIRELMKQHNIGHWRGYHHYNSHALTQKRDRLLKEFDLELATAIYWQSHPDITLKRIPLLQLFLVSHRPITEFKNIPGQALFSPVKQCCLMTTLEASN